MSTPTPARAAVPVEAGEPYAWSVESGNVAGRPWVESIYSLEENARFLAQKLGPSARVVPLYAAPVPRQAAQADEALLRQAVEALQGCIDWDKSRGFIVTYKVRDPMRAALAALSARLADSAAQKDAAGVQPTGGEHG